MEKGSEPELFYRDVSPRTLLSDTLKPVYDAVDCQQQDALVCHLKRKYVDIYTNKSNTTDKCGGGEDEKRREAVRNRLLQEQSYELEIRSVSWR